MCSNVCSKMGVGESPALHLMVLAVAGDRDEEWGGEGESFVFAGIDGARGSLYVGSVARTSAVPGGLLLQL